MRGELKLEERADHLPDGWEQVSIGDVCELGGGKTPRKSNSDYWGGDIPWASPKDFNGVSLSETEDNLTEKGSSENGVNRYKPGDIAMVVRSGVLRHSLPVARLTTEMAVNQDVKVLQPKTERITSKYLLNILLYEANRIRASCAKTGTTVESIETGFLKAYKIPLPPLSEQHRIANILATTDEQIHQVDKKIEKTEELKRGLVQDLLVRQGSESPQSVRFGPLKVDIPDSWTVTTMEEICTSRQLGTSERGDPDDDGVSLIKMGNLGIGTWDLTDVETIRHSEDILDKCELKQGDLLFNTRNSPDLVGKTAVWEFDSPAVFDNNLLRLRFNSEVYDSRFINLYLSSDLGRNYLQSLVHGTTSVAAIYWKDLKNLKVPLPALDVQRQIVNLMDSIDSQISTEREYKRSLQELKRGLMQDLLTGDVRVTTDS